MISRRRLKGTLGFTISISCISHESPIEVPRYSSLRYRWVWLNIFLVIVIPFHTYVSLCYDHQHHPSTRIDCCVPHVMLENLPFEGLNTQLEQSFDVGACDESRCWCCGFVQVVVFVNICCGCGACYPRITQKKPGFLLPLRVPEIHSQQAGSFP